MKTGQYLNKISRRFFGLVFRYPKIFLRVWMERVVMFPVSVNRCFETIKAWMISAYGEEGHFWWVDTSLYS